MVRILWKRIKNGTGAAKHELGALVDLCTVKLEGMKVNMRANGAEDNASWIDEFERLWFDHGRNETRLGH